MNVPGRDLLHAPLGDIIRDVALSIADAQRGLDEASTRTAEFMSGRVVLRDPDSGAMVDAAGNPTPTPVVASSEVVFGHAVNADGERVPRLVSMMELGFVPTFYQFVDTTIEMKLSVRLTGSGHSARRFSAAGTAIAHGERTLSLHASTVDAGFASAYGYSADLATTVSTKLVPIPPPAALDAQIARLLADTARVDINSANADELAALVALGPKLAAALVEEREKGPFASLADLRDRVNGIGQKTIDAIRDVVSV